MAKELTLAEQIVGTIKANIKPYNLISSKREIAIRCPYCGDSRNSARSTHLYINLEEPFWFYCQRCNTTGRMTPEFLRDAKVFDSGLSLQLFEVGKKYKYTKGKKKGQAGFAEKRLFIPPPSGKKSELEKLRYLNDRLGSDYTAEEASHRFKAILNFGDFCIQNEINEFTEGGDMVKKLNKHGIGFLSYDQSNIIFRSVSDVKESGFRYHNYNVFGEYENTKRFYTVASKIDILEPKLKVVVTEGILDQIGVYTHFYRGKDNSNTLFTAINGKGYHLVFQHLARLGFLDLDLEIYSDADVDIDFYKYMKNGSPLLRLERIKVFYNRIGKDYGVRKEHIQLRHTII